MSQILSKTAYGISREHGLVDQVVKLTKRGCEVDIHRTCAVGLGSFLIYYKEPETEVVDDGEGLAPEKEQGLREAKTPDWSLVDSFKSKKQIQEYAEQFGVTLEEGKMKDMISTFKGSFE